MPITSHSSILVLPGTERVITQRDGSYYCSFHQHSIVPVWIGKWPERQTSAGCRECLSEEMDLLLVAKPGKEPEVKVTPKVIACDFALTEEVEEVMHMCGWDVCTDRSTTLCANPACELPLCKAHCEDGLCLSCKVRQAIDVGPDEVGDDYVEWGKCEFCGDDARLYIGMCPRCVAEAKPAKGIVVVGEPQEN